MYWAFVSLHWNTCHFMGQRCDLTCSLCICTAWNMARGRCLVYAGQLRQIKKFLTLCAYLSPRSLRTSALGVNLTFCGARGPNISFGAGQAAFQASGAPLPASSPHLPDEDSIMILMCVRQSTALGVPWSQTTRVPPLPSLYPLCSHWHPKASLSGPRAPNASQATWWLRIKFCLK